ncbi:MAG: hypothetical protein ABS43_01645 [Bordetella sp. SCN 67-23]|nr:ParB/RepB/Spo0J family partition protein [Burkholderiales bacterium]ODS76275.1 MAG: hypothetical protein ABS43_01645 [Bordetella sp. SCN 67-23]OJW90078.1 MAG: hypothetical protein BGO71_27580 [Burkholderiales bacterium 67-32]
MNAMTTAESLGMQHPVEHGTTCYLPHALVHSSKTNPRKRFFDESLTELARSLKQLGQLQPIVVRPHPDLAGQYELIAGERRWRATGINDDEFILARVVHVSDLEALELQVIENMQREDLHPLEEAEGYEALMRSHADRTGYSVEEVAAKLGKSKAYIYARMKLCALTPEAREAFYADKLTASTALLLARLPNATMQSEALNTITGGEWGGEPMSFRRAAEHIKSRYMLRLDQAKFPIADAALLPSAGSCRECPKRTGANPDLFSDVGSADVCTDPECHAQKVEAHSRRLLEAAQTRGQRIIEGAEAKRIMPYGQFSMKGYVLLDNRCDAAPVRPIAEADRADIDSDREEFEDTQDEGGDDEYQAPTHIHPMYRELLGDEHLKHSVTIIDPQSGEALTAIPAEIAAEGLQSQGINDWRVSNSLDSGRSAADTRDENKKRREKQRQEIAYRKRLVADIRTATQAGEPANDEDGSIRLTHTVILASSLFHRTDPRACKELADMLGWKKPDYGRWELADVRRRFAALDPLQLAELLLLLIVLPALGIDEYRNPSSVELVDIAESLGINTKAVRREVVSAMKPTAKKTTSKKAEPTKAPAKGRRAKASADSDAPDEIVSAEAGESAPLAELPAPETSERATWSTDDRVRVKEDSRGPNRKRLKVCGRIGTITGVNGQHVAVEFDDGSKHASLLSDQLEPAPTMAESPADTEATDPATEASA